MIKEIFILTLILSSCFSKQAKHVSTEITDSGEPDSSISEGVDRLDKVIIDNDTIFLKREVTKHYYHAIFIDTTRDSKYYDRLTDFEFGTFDLQSYEGNYKYFKGQNPKAYKKVNSTEIPKNWIPVYLYKNHYYLYAPSDWGSARKRIINDSAFVYWYMDGPMPIPLTSVRKLEKDKYIIEMTDFFNKEPTIRKLTIHQIEPKTGLSIFEFVDEPKKYKYQLYVPIESAKQFDMIVNYCDKQKQSEFNFDQIDFAQLLMEAKKSYKQ